MGGRPAGPVSRHEHEIEPWEKRIEALVRCLQLRERPVLTVDELRRHIEELPPNSYDSLSYYEKWIAALANLLLEKGVLTRDELDARIAAVKAKATPPA